MDGGLTLPVPGISSIELVTDPGDDSTYVAGDWVGAKVTFGESGSVTGTPRLELSIGTTDRIARFGQGSFEGSVSHDPIATDTGRRVDAVAPVVSSIAISSRAGGDRRYAIGNSIEVTIAFSEAATVSGAPQLDLDLGGEAKTATCNFTGDSTAVFAYVVQEGYADTDGIAVDADTLSLDDGGDLEDVVKLSDSEMALEEYRLDDPSQRLTTLTNESGGF